MDKHGFTIIEMTVVVFILTTAILGIGASATYMIEAAYSAPREVGGSPGSGRADLPDRDGSEI